MSRFLTLFAPINPPFCLCVYLVLKQSRRQKEKRSSSPCGLLRVLLRPLSEYNVKLLLFLPPEERPFSQNPRASVQSPYAKIFSLQEVLCYRNMKMLQTPLKCFKINACLIKITGEEERLYDFPLPLHFPSTCRSFSACRNRIDFLERQDMGWYDDEQAVQHLSQRARLSVGQFREMMQDQPNEPKLPRLLCRELQRLVRSSTRCKGVFVESRCPIGELHRWRY